MRRVVLRCAVIATSFQGVAWLLIGFFGFADYAGAPVLRSALAGTQILGLSVLARLGWCCGLAGGFVISDFASNRWGGLTLAGAPVLLLANWIALFILLVVAHTAAYGVRTRSRPDGTCRCASRCVALELNV
jgi:hypothetical protein